jgi:hypothetical protein
MASSYGGGVPDVDLLARLARRPIPQRVHELGIGSDDEVPHG